MTNNGPTKCEQARWGPVVVLLLLAAGAIFVWRGPVRALHMGDDLGVYYTCTRVWLHGGNPYDPAALRAEAIAAGGAPAGLLSNALGPPTTFVLMAPLALLDWPTARAVWLGVNLLSLALAFVALAKLTKATLTPARALLLAALVLGLAPVQTSVALGQLILPVTAFVVWGIVAHQGGRGVWAGILFALAAALKPQVGAVFLGYLLVRGRWRGVLAGAVVVSAILAVGVLRMTIAQQPWLDTLQANYQAFFHGGDGDPTSPARYQLLQLQYPLTVLLGRPSVASVLAWGATVVLGAALLWLLRRGRRPSDELLAFGIVGVLGLLPIYHRSYDAAILMIPLAWALAAQAPAQRPWARVGLVLILPFLLPGAAMLHALGAGGGLPSWVVDSWWWRGIVVPHQVWLILALAVALTAGLAKVTLWREGTDSITTPAGSAGFPDGATPPSC